MSNREGGSALRDVAVVVAGGLLTGMVLRYIHLRSQPSAVVVKPDGNGGYTISNVGNSAA